MTRKKHHSLHSRPPRLQTYAWQEGAACANAPERDKEVLTGWPSREDAVEMKQRYCDRCPVLHACLNWAFDDRHFTGIAGGMVFVENKNCSGMRRAEKIGTK